MNFTDFRGIENSDSYFWKIAIPFSFATILFLARDMIGRSIVQFANRRLIKRGRKRREKTREEAKKNSINHDPRKAPFPAKANGTAFAGR